MGLRGRHFLPDAWSSSKVGAMNYIDGLMAGNDIEFTSGSMSSLSKWLDSNTVKMRLRESAKHTLYAMSHSNAMNSLQSDSEIIHLTPWWQYVIVVIDIVSILLVVGSGAMLLRSILKYRKESRGK